MTSRLASCTVVDAMAFISGSPKFELVFFAETGDSYFTASTAYSLTSSLVTSLTASLAKSLSYYFSEFVGLGIVYFDR